jgi:hypothetical protein
MIYFVSNNEGQIKIGSTSDFKRRLIELQVGSPYKLTPLYYIEDGDLQFEHHIQGVCKKYLISGEWFDIKVIEEHLLKHPFYKSNMKVI